MPFSATGSGRLRGTCIPRAFTGKPWPSISATLGRATICDDPAIFRNLRHRVVQSMLEQMYDAKDAAFYDVCQPGSATLRVRTPTIFFPLAAAEIDQKIAARVVETHFDREDGFRVPLPLPSVELRDAAFFAGT